MPDTRVTIRLDFGTDQGKNSQLGHGKIRLLEMIAEHGSISSAARAMKMSYRRAWLLLNEVNAMFSEPVIETQLGGKGGGHAKLTEFGQGLVSLYRTIESDAGEKFAGEIRKLEGRLKRGNK